MEGSMISETPHWALTHTHTWITCRPCQSFSGLLYYTSSPMVGMTICLHVATLVGVCVCASVLVCMRACVCTRVPRRPATCYFPVCVHVSAQAGRKAASRLQGRDCKLWTLEWSFGWLFQNKTSSGISGMDVILNISVHCWGKKWDINVEILGLQNIMI